MNTASKKTTLNGKPEVFFSQDELNFDSDKHSAGHKPFFNATKGSNFNKKEEEPGVMGATQADFTAAQTRPGQLMKEGPVYIKKLQAKEYPETVLDANDYKKRLRFEELKSTKLEEMCNWKQKDIKGTKKNAYIKEIQRKNEKILTVAEKDELEKLEVYTDRFPLLELRKSIHKFFILMHLVAFEIISSKLFDNVSIGVILVNSAVMMVDDPTQEPSEFSVIADNIFLILYSCEMFLKILGLGFIVGENSYLKDSWNILDFVIVVSSYPALFADPNAPSDGSFSLSGLRAFRVMRPLKTISSVKGLKVLMQALFQAMPLLRDTIIILLFFFAIFAIMGLNLMSGQLKVRCMSI